MDPDLEDAVRGAVWELGGGAWDSDEETSSNGEISEGETFNEEASIRGFSGGSKAVAKTQVKHKVGVSDLIRLLGSPDLGEEALLEWARAWRAGTFEPEDPGDWVLDNVEVSSLPAAHKAVEAYMLATLVYDAPDLLEAVEVLMSSSPTTMARRFVKDATKALEVSRSKGPISDARLRSLSQRAVSEGQGRALQVSLSALYTAAEVFMTLEMDRLDMEYEQFRLRPEFAKLDRVRGEATRLQAQLNQGPLEQPFAPVAVSLQQLAPKVRTFRFLDPALEGLPQIAIDLSQAQTLTDLKALLQRKLPKINGQDVDGFEVAVIGKSGTESDDEAYARLLVNGQVPVHIVAKTSLGEHNLAGGSSDGIVIVNQGSQPQIDQILPQVQALLQSRLAGANLIPQATLDRWTQLATSAKTGAETKLTQMARDLKQEIESKTCQRNGGDGGNEGDEGDGGNEGNGGNEDEEKKDKEVHELVEQLRASLTDPAKLIKALEEIETSPKVTKDVKDSAGMAATMIKSLPMVGGSRIGVTPSLVGGDAERDLLILVTAIQTLSSIWSTVAVQNSLSSMSEFLHLARMMDPALNRINAILNGRPMPEVVVEGCLLLYQSQLFETRKGLSEDLKAAIEEIMDKVARTLNKDTDNVFNVHRPDAPAPPPQPADYQLTQLVQKAINYKNQEQLFTDPEYQYVKNMFKCGSLADCDTELALPPPPPPPGNKDDAWYEKRVEEILGVPGDTPTPGKLSPAAEISGALAYQAHMISKKAQNDRQTFAQQMMLLKRVQKTLNEVYFKTETEGSKYPVQVIQAPPVPPPPPGAPEDPNKVVFTKVISLDLRSHTGDLFTPVELAYVKSLVECGSPSCVSGGLSAGLAGGVSILKRTADYVILKVDRGDLESLTASLEGDLSWRTMEVPVVRGRSVVPVGDRVVQVTPWGLLAARKRVVEPVQNLESVEGLEGLWVPHNGKLVAMTPGGRLVSKDLEATSRVPASRAPVSRASVSRSLPRSSMVGSVVGRGVEVPVDVGADEEETLSRLSHAVVRSAPRSEVRLPSVVRDTSRQVSGEVADTVLRVKRAQEAGLPWVDVLSEEQWLERCANLLEYFRSQGRDVTVLLLANANRHPSQLWVDLVRTLQARR